jgi:hypothetical protein
MTRRVWTSCVAAVLMVVPAGCGYSLAGRGSFLPAHIMTIGIPPVENRTGTPRIEQLFTERIRIEFINRGKYKILLDATGADALLRGEIAAVTVQPAGVNERQLADRYLVTVVLKVSFIDLKNNNEVIWANDALTVRGEYELSARGGVDGASLVDQQSTMVERLSTDVARTVVTAIMEAF